MKLIQSLRTHILSKVQHLADNPDRLIISVEKGGVKWNQGSLSHRQTYTAVIEIDDYPESLDANFIIVPLIDWYASNQDPLSPKDPSPINFESYVLSNNSTTVVFTIEIQEAVVVRTDDNGQYEIDACPMPTFNPKPFIDNP